METMADYNAAMAEAAAADAAGDREVLLRKAQGASLESANSIAGEITAARDARLSALDDQFWKNYGRRKYYGASEEELAAMEAAYQTARGNEAQNYNDTLQAMWQAFMNDSDLADVFAQAMIDANDAVERYKNGGNNLMTDSYIYMQTYRDAARTMQAIVDSFGGIENVPAEWQAMAGLLTGEWSEETFEIPVNA